MRPAKITTKSRDLKCRTTKRGCQRLFRRLTDSMRKWQTPGVLGSLRQMLLSQMPKNISQLGLLFPIYGKSKKSCSKPPLSISKVRTPLTQRKSFQISTKSELFFQCLLKKKNSFFGMKWASHLFWKTITAIFLDSPKTAKCHHVSFIVNLQPEDLHSLGGQHIGSSALVMEPDKYCD